MPHRGSDEMSKTSLALNNLRGYAILIILAFHSCIAYVSHQPVAALPFDKPPYAWMANPIVDGDRWLGFDIFCAFTFLYMMQLMFFLSGLFVWPSLKRKSAAVFFYDRFLRLGVPFAFGIYLLMPLAYFAVYRQTAVDPSWPAYWAHLRALPFRPDGPLWFLWILLAFNVAAAIVFWIAPVLVELPARLSAKASPARLFMALAGVAVLLSLIFGSFFTPWRWIDYGPLSFQPFELPQYAAFFLFGVVVGASGLERSFFAANGLLAGRWGRWLAATLASFVVWISLSALIFGGWKVPGLQIVAELAQVVFAATACFAASAIFLRFGAKNSPILDGIAENGYGLYLFHYVFVLWAQYLLLDVELPAIAKGAIVFGVTLALSWAVTAAVCSVPFGARVLRGQRRTALAAARATAKPTTAERRAARQTEV
jgi:glucans biosynthesis protein C